jgi:aminoglycoside phosphotransferase (APT) family kinase protein
MALVTGEVLMALVARLGSETTSRGLEACLRARIPGADNICVTSVESTLASGFSTETVMFEACWTAEGRPDRRRLVARVQPDGPGVFPDYNLAEECRVITALTGHSAVSVPELLFHEPDPAYLGAGFIVMDRVDGRVPADDPPFTTAGWVVDLSPEQRTLLYDNALRLIAEVHATNWRTAGLTEVGPPDAGKTPLDRQLAYLERFASFSGGGQPDPLVVTGIEWLRENRPTGPEPTVLCWGDARFANMIFGVDLSIVAAVDWEQATLASPELDLGWFLYALCHYTDGIGVPHPDGFPTPDQAALRYAELTGHTPRHLDFYQRLAAVRGALIMGRVARIMIDAGFVPAESDLATNNSTTHLLAQMLDLPAPAGSAAEWLGQR